MKAGETERTQTLIVIDTYLSCCLDSRRMWAVQERREKLNCFDVHLVLLAAAAALRGLPYLKCIYGTVWSTNSLFSILVRKERRE